MTNLYQVKCILKHDEDKVILSPYAWEKEEAERRASSANQHFKGGKHSITPAGSDAIPYDSSINLDPNGLIKFLNTHEEDEDE